VLTLSRCVVSSFTSLLAACSLVRQGCCKDRQLGVSALVFSETASIGSIRFGVWVAGVLFRGFPASLLFVSIFCPPASLRRCLVSPTPSGVADASLLVAWLLRALSASAVQLLKPRLRMEGPQRLPSGFSLAHLCSPGLAPRVWAVGSVASAADYRQARCLHRVRVIGLVRCGVRSRLRLRGATRTYRAPSASVVRSGFVCVL